MNYLIKFIFLIVFIINSNALANSFNNKIIFKINDEVYTNIDFESRLKYINLINNINTNELDNDKINEILEDYISALIFYSYKNKYNIDIGDLNKEVETLFNENIKNKLIGFDFKKEEILNIKRNINIDLIRKKIIENLLNENKDILIKETKIKDLLYSYNIQSISFKKIDSEIINIGEINNKSDFINLKETLTNNNISFFFNEKEIIDSTKVSKLILDKLNNNVKIFEVKDKKFYIIYLIEKQLESYEGIFANIISIKTENEMDQDKLNCEYLKANKKITTFKEYEYIKLNDKIKNNLKSINDYIYFYNNNTFNYIFLCDLKYDENILNNINLNKKVNSLAKQIQLKFLNKYKYEFNFEMIDE